MSRSSTNTRDAKRGSSSNVLGRTISVRGRVTGDGDLTVAGSVEGEVRVSGDLGIDASGTVQGNAFARAVTIEGTLDGDVQATSEVWLRAGCKVRGNMMASQIALEEGAAFDGRIEADFDLPDGLVHGFGAAQSGGRKDKPRKR